MIGLAPKGSSELLVTPGVVDVEIVQPLISAWCLINADGIYGELNRLHVWHNGNTCRINGAGGL
jgi:hypothetical protein